MREIKFRGKGKDSGEWICGSLLYLKADNIQIWRKEKDGTWNYVVDPATVGQYTGLKDKNGVEIYEGDVLLYREMNRRAGVSWRDGGFIVYDVNDPDKWQALNDDDASQVISQIMEVINNVHDAPKLLEK